jgi:hypothetical protein
VPVKDDVLHQNQPAHPIIFYRFKYGHVKIALKTIILIKQNIMIFKKESKNSPFEIPPSF